ncbi:pantothenate synthetase [Phakopsora pachyrhizi]|nr:pantothenate synthetase [Phakopsora pachyrhizi]
MSNLQKVSGHHHFHVLRTVEEVRRWMKDLENPESVGFVPTMGALHSGHLQLVRHSVSNQCHTVVSIFLNPAQFAPSEDLSSYPITLESDLAKLNELAVRPGSYPIPHNSFDGSVTLDETKEESTDESSAERVVSAVFLPTKDVLYPSGIEPVVEEQKGAFVIVHGLSEQLEGARRPGFFRGVATVVLKLFMIVQPSLAFFGQKDLQQCFVVRQLCKDFHIIRPGSIVVVPTVRDHSSGLALSSRNVYLSEIETISAKALFKFLRQCACQLATSQETPSVEELSKVFKPPTDSISLDFVSLNSPIDFSEILPGTGTKDLAFVVSGAILVKCQKDGQTVRLIDNIVINHDLNSSI